MKIRVKNTQKGGPSRKIVLFLVLTALLASTVFSFAADSDPAYIMYENQLLPSGNWDVSCFEGHEAEWLNVEGTWNTAIRKLTKIKTEDGTIYNCKNDEELGESYLYCMEPGTNPPPEKKWQKLEVVDDDDSGKLAKLRKAVYYIYGSPGYKSTTKSRWFQAYKDDGGRSGW